MKYEIDDGFNYGSCVRHMRPGSHTHVHTSSILTDEDFGVIVFLNEKSGNPPGILPGMMRQEAISDFQMRDFDAYGVSCRRGSKP